MTAGGETERTFRKLRQRRCGDPFQKNRIFCGHTDDLFFAAEQDVKVILVDRGNRKDPELCNAGEKLLRLLRNAAFMDLIIDEREEAMKRLETFLDEDSRSGIGDREAQGPFAAVTDISDLIFCHIFQRADVLGLVVQDAACIRQDEMFAPAGRDDELRTEVIFQRLHLFGESRLRDVDIFGGSGHAACFHNREKVSVIINFHINLLCIQIMSARIGNECTWESWFYILYKK